MATLRAVMFHIGPDICIPGGSIERVKIRREIRRNFVEHRQVTRDYRYTKAQRFHKRHAVTFDERREQQGACVLQPCAELYIAAIRFFDDHSTQRLAAFKHIYNVFALPATPTDNDKLGRVVTHLFNKAPPDMKNEPVVLARFDRAQHNEIRLIDGGRR
ncbi:hypothetical protein WS96_20560 [Burkholderia sp. MSMB1835]|nr:hypothetical protein WS96_20560 [Burkholderia sp. MSMB1835]